MKEEMIKNLLDMKAVYEIVAEKLPFCPEELKRVSSVIVVYINSALELLKKEELSKEEDDAISMYLDLLEDSIKEYVEIVEKTWPGLLELMGQK